MPADAMGASGREQVVKHTFSPRIVGLHEDVVVTHAFVIEALSSDHPTVIKKIESSCGCTDASIDKPVIRANEKAYVSVTMNLSPESGIRSESVLLSLTSGARQKVVRLVVACEVYAACLFTPHRPQVGNINPGDQLRMSETVTFTADKGTLTEQDISYSTDKSDDISVEIRSISAHDSQPVDQVTVEYFVSIAAQSMIPSSPSRESAEVTWKAGDITKTRVYEWILAPRIKAVPEFIFVQANGSTDGSLRKAIVRLVCDVPFSITGISSGKDDIIGRARPSGARKQHKIEVLASPAESTETGNVASRSIITVHTDLADQEMLKIPVFILTPRRNSIK